MPKARLLLLALLGLAGACSEPPPAPAVPQQAVAIPAGEAAQPAQLELAGHVTDAAGILTESQKAALSERLQQLQIQTGHQIVVVTVPSLGGRPVADFTRDLGNRWGIGSSAHDNGVVLLVAPNERQARIAVGYGLESRLTDATAQQIMSDHIIPKFSAGDLHGGISAGADAIIGKLTVPGQPPLLPGARDATPLGSTSSKETAHAG